MKRKKILDKDKLILLFNVYIGDMDTFEAERCLMEASNGLKGYFDESVKCIFAVTKDQSKQTVQNITDFPEEGIDLIRELVKFYESNDKEALKLQINAVKNYLDTYYDESE